MDINIDKLKKENDKLKSQLTHARDWMRKEVSGGEYNHRETVEEKIYSFFSPESLSHFPTHGIDHIISAESIYKHLLAGENIDGMGVILSYGKILDEMIELYITKGFRKYISKQKNLIPSINDPLEKALKLIVEKKHIFSLGRVYGILQSIKSGKPLSGYQREFSYYIKSRPFLEKALLGTDFLLQLQGLIDLHAITDKRHSGSLSKKDTIQARNLIIGGFEQHNCILQILAGTQSTDI